MNTSVTNGPTVFPDSKKHYPVLDGLRGVAAVVVVFFHIFEVFSGGDHTKQFINHGYLAVDFFFLLSGFVIAHAYDDRWGRMTLTDFFKRRLIRLHPMIIVGMLLGAVCFYWQASPMFPLIAETPVWKMLLVCAIGLTLVPVTIPMDIRGWAEMHPLNGPAWSLFFEYVANIFYALFLRKVSKALLTVLVVISAGVLVHYAVTSPGGDVIGGWSIDATQLRIGFTRLAYPFLAGMLLCRMYKPGTIKYGFLISSVLIVGTLAFPRVGGSEQLWANGLYDSLMIIFMFPLIIYLGAGGEVNGNGTRKLCNFLGDISYPIYITHYPIVYVFYGWVSRNNVSLPDAIPTAIVVFFITLAVAYLSLRLYDAPVRKWLTNKYLKRQ